MTFRAEDIPAFLEMFGEVQSKISAMPGCRGVELLRVIDQPHILMTYSYWETPDDLEHYRNSDLFKTTWAKTRTWFSAKPEAWSVERIQ